MELAGVAVKVRETADAETGVKLLELMADEIKDVKIRIAPAAVIVADAEHQ